MSILSFPRIHFNGQFHTSPTTSNNDYESMAIDEANVRLLEPLLSMTDDAARQWLISTFVAQGTTWLRCGWNYYGDYDTNFDSAAVSAVTLQGGASPSSDPLLGSAVSLVGEAGTYPVICDCDPTGIVTTQIFVGGFSIGGSKLGIQARGNTRCYSRWRNNLRNVSTAPGSNAGAIFQFAVPKSGITFNGAARSPLLSQLENAMQSALGLIFQFTVYQILPTLQESALAAQYAQGNFIANPAVGPVTGTIGLWEKGDMQTDLNSRRLYPPTTFNLNYQGTGYTLGPAAFQVQSSGNLISLNFANTIPETGYTAPLQKVNLGNLRLMVQPPGGGAPQLACIVTPDLYNYDCYWNCGGIVDVTCSPSIDPRGQFLLLADASQGNTVLLSEPDLVVESDSRALYIDQPGSATVQLTVKERGGPPSSNFTLRLWEYQFQFCPTQAPPVDWNLIPASVPRIHFAAQVAVPAGQTQPLTVPVQGINPGSLTLLYTVNNDPPPDHNMQPCSQFPPNEVFPWMYAYFTNMRVLPEDNYDHIATPTYQDIYHEILRYYYLIYPAMSQIIPFNSEDAVSNAASAMLKRIDPAIWESCLFMPVTREMSAGKRQLFTRWAQSVIPKSGLTP